MTTEDLSSLPDESLFFVDVGKGKGRPPFRGSSSPLGGQRPWVSSSAPGSPRRLRAKHDPARTFTCAVPARGRVTESAPVNKLKEWKMRQRPARVGKSEVHSNTYALLEHADEDCTMAARLWEKASNCVQHLAAELDVEPVKDLPPVIRCGQLRSAVAGCFPGGGPSLQARLSIKTTQKLERSCCRSCQPRFDEIPKRWREARFQPLEVDQSHLELFSRMFKSNIPTGWNRHKYPFIPNGNASLMSKRHEGGNWNREPFSRRCRYDLVFSDGKPRVVTMYSSYNNSVLHPLHQSLQRTLEKQGWLLVGPPVAERINALSGEGDYLSFDYTSATDNIKQPYVEKAVEALIARADPKLDDDQIRCLRVLSELRFEEDGPIATRGQPMGSLMSFPLLSLINKTVVDLALADLLQGGQLSFKEWTSHRLMVNGDDLLTREPRARPGKNSLAAAVFRHGGQVGLESNWEKTLCDPVNAEINSTLFSRGDLVKKTNVASLYMKPEVDDVLGFALESTTTTEGFRRVVRANIKLLSRQTRKGYRDLPLPLQRLCKRDRKIRRALTSGPASEYKPEATNFFPVCPRPEGYDLPVEEEIQLIHERVDKVRPAALNVIGRRQDSLPARKGRPHDHVRSWRSVKYEKRPPKAEESILCVLASGWNRKQKERLVEEEAWNPPTGLIGPSDLPGGRINALADAIRAFRKAKDIRCDPITPVPEEGTSPFDDGSEWIALE